MGQWCSTSARGSANRSGPGWSAPMRRVRHAELFDTDEPGWFADDAPIRRVHADASMFVGGLRALLFQSLHPLAMAGVAQHSDYRRDPWGRLQRTADFLAATTFGPATQAQRAVDRVHRVHRPRRRCGLRTASRYAANDPHLLEWVHIAELDSFLAAHDRYGDDPLVGARSRSVRRRGSRGGKGARRGRSARDRSRSCVYGSPRSVPNCAAPARHATPLATCSSSRRCLWPHALPYGLIAGAAVALMPAWTRRAAAPAVAAGVGDRGAAPCRRARHPHAPLGHHRLRQLTFTVLAGRATTFACRSGRDGSSELQHKRVEGGVQGGDHVP